MKNSAFRFITVFVLAVAMLMSMTAFAAQTDNPVSKFTDVKASDWFYEAVDYNVNVTHTMNGVSDTQFAPLGQMTRAQFVTILGRLNGVDVTKYSKATAFKDVVVNSWYGPYVQWAVENGITNGTSATTFSPNAAIQRQQAATFMARYIQKFDSQFPDGEKTVASFKDASAIDDYAKASIEELRRTGILVGDNNGNINPAATITRAEGATMLMRMSKIEASIASQTPETPEVTPDIGEPIHKHNFVRDFEPDLSYHIEEHEVCYICGQDLTEMNYSEMVSHLRTHSYSDPSRMQTKIKYEKVETRASQDPYNRDVAIVSEHCSICNEARKTEYPLEPVYATVEVPVYKMVSCTYCSECGADCSKMSEKQWCNHIEAHMLNQGRMAYRYEYWTQVEVGTEQQQVQVGGISVDTGEQFHANTWTPDYTVYEKAPIKGYMKVIRCKTCNILVQFKLFTENDQMIYQYQVPSSVVDQHDKDEGNSSADKWSRKAEPCVYAYEMLRIFNGYKAIA